MTSRQNLLSGAALTLLVIGGVYLATQGHAPDKAASPADPVLAAAYWEAQIQKGDPREVYASFTEDTRTKGFEAQHLLAHIMGELLYARLGVGGIAVCDAEFGFGCYHGFMGRAISEGGKARVKELDTACVEAFGQLGTGCQHGIGHGVLEYVGYGRVNDALALCTDTTQVAPLLGCPSGVFMEYNSPLMGVGDRLIPSARAITPETIYEPCDTVPSEYRDSCYYQLGEWLAPSLSGDLSQVGQICANKSGSARLHCFLGAGTGIVFQARYETDAARTSCASFASGDDELACRAGVSWGMWSDPAHRAQAKDACAYADATQTNRCLALSDLTAGLDPH